MAKDKNFLDKIGEANKLFILSPSGSRSTAKLKPIHGVIAKDIADMIGDNYEVISQGYGEDKEKKVNGRYSDKNVDIAIIDKQTEKVVSSIAVKFVMQNYSQNSKNYFENMLGETANIRKNNINYFQVFIIPDKLPHYKKDKKTGEYIISYWEKFTDHNIDQYIKLSEDNPNTNPHIPNNTLLYVIHITPDVNEESVKTKKEYLEYYRNNTPTIILSENKYPSFNEDGSVIYNNYEKFMSEVSNTVLSKKELTF